MNEGLQKKLSELSTPKRRNFVIPAGEYGRKGIMGSLVTYNTLEGRLLKLFPFLIAYKTLQSLSPCYVFHLVKLLGSLSNHDDDGNKNLTNLHI